VTQLQVFVFIGYTMLHNCMYIL